MSRRQNDTREDLGVATSQRSRPSKASGRRAAYRGKDMTITTAKRAIVIYRLIGLMSLVLIVASAFVFNMWVNDERAGAFANGHSQGLEDAGGQYKKVKLPAELTPNLIGISGEELSDKVAEYGIPGVSGRVTLTNSRLVGIQQPLGDVKSSSAVIQSCYMKKAKPQPINYSVRIIMTTQDVTVAQPSWIIGSVALVGRECR